MVSKMRGGHEARDAEMGTEMGSVVQILILLLRAFPMSLKYLVNSRIVLSQAWLIILTLLLETVKNINHGISP
jgi:hypothetical protein